MNNCSISGSGTLSAGEYADVRCSGAAKINGSIKCQSIHVSGACHAVGDIDCAADAKFSGSFHSDGIIKAALVAGSGSFKAGSVSGEEARLSGAAAINGDIEVKTFESAGKLTCSGDINADSAVIRGVVSVGGQLNSDNTDIQFDTFGNNRIPSIVGEKIKISRKHGESRRISILGIISIGRKNENDDGCLSADLIEGDELNLDGVEAETVRGVKVCISGKSRIARVEYSESYECDESSKVTESVKI